MQKQMEHEVEAGVVSGGFLLGNITCYSGSSDGGLVKILES